MTERTDRFLGVILVILLTSAVWWLYAMAGGFTGLYEDRFGCPRQSECQVQP